ncbi:MAG: SDR family oxidoreductase [Alphaproteobacteria bacterium]|nr:SDR family oxidoreductase [Alphaproteobacteria bacterium]
MNRLFCFGFGYSATVLAHRLKAQGWRIAGTARTREKVKELTAQGIEAYQFDAPLSHAAAALAGTTHILVSTPPNVGGDPALTHHVHDLSALTPRPQWVGYLSTTGVYGDHQGGWVDEATPVTPSNERAKRRIAAEHAWAAWGAAVNVPVHIFRLAGIYGPGQNQLVSLREGKARRIIKPGQVFSRIHVEDIATVLEASIAKPNAGAIYNVCDDEPAPPDEVVAYAAKLLNIDPPPSEPFEEAARTLSDMALSFYLDSKRVKNDRIKQDLGVTLRYPTYREGLTALLAEDGR